MGAAAALKYKVLLFCASELTNGGYEASNTLVSFPAGRGTSLLQHARDAAKDIMDGDYGEYSLLALLMIRFYRLLTLRSRLYSDNYFNIFAQHGKWNSETIWAIQAPLTVQLHYHQQVERSPALSSQLG
jgi:hypothetical protein